MTADAASDAGVGCGNGEIDGAERCDGADLGDEACTTLGQGYTGGTLSCSSVCVFDTSGCTIPPGCGDGSIDPPEQCDGGAFGGMTCQTLGFATGALACAPGCIFDSSECWTCGDGLIQPIETCDGTNTGGATCTSLGYAGGTLACAADCFALDPSTCTGGPPTVPVLRRPVNNSYVGSIFVSDSRRPTFAWEASTVIGGVSIDYEIQYSTSATFAAGVTTAMVSSTNYEPPLDLPVAIATPIGSRYYWRVRACAMGVCSVYSPVHWINVGRSDRDFGGDGYADIAMGAPTHNVATVDGAAYVYVGGAAGPASIPVVTIIGSFNQYLGYPVASAGDVNGDAFSDLIVGASGISSGDPGHAYVYFGAAGGGFDAVPETTLTGEATNDAFGSPVAGAGDVNADGYDDLLVGARLHDSAGADAGRAYIYLGGPGIALDPSPDAVLDGAAMNDHFGAAAASAGDVNGDGFADVVIGAFGYASNTGAAYVYLGGPAGLGTAAAGIMIGEAPFDAFGAVVAGVGDLNDDGFSDILVSATSAAGGGMYRGRVYLFLGSGAATLDVTGDLVLSGASDGDYFGASLGAADLNGDGHMDVAIGAPQTGPPGLGEVVVYFGSSSGVDATPETTLTGAAVSSGFGGGLHGAGDVNGDAYDDLLVGAPSAMSAGIVYLYLGAAGATLDTMPDATYVGTSSEALGLSVY
jgi:hypothetical protein